jgi:purine-binding chemotaxis protein CheW
MPTVDMPPVQVLLFEVGRRLLAVHVGVVHEVVRAVAITPLPMAPRVVEGVINYRGTLVPVLDVRGRFGLPPDPLEPDQHFLVVQTAGRLVALRVDRAHDVVDIDPGTIEQAEGVVPGAVHLAGLAGHPNGVVVIQDVDRFLSLHEAAEVDGALARAQAG